MSVHLRTYIEADAPVINKLAVLAFSQYSDKYNDWPALSKVMERMSDMASTAEIIIAEHDGRLIGAVGYLPPFAAWGSCGWRTRRRCSACRMAST